MTTVSVSADAMEDKSALRDASTVILWRIGKSGAEVLMGARGATAAFMPNKFVFPGGAVDPSDNFVPLAGRPDTTCMRRLSAAPRPCSKATAEGLLAAAIREVWEETGLILGKPDPQPNPPGPDWVDYSATGHLPDASDFRFVFRAVTPPGRPRRFDARFFLVEAATVRGSADDFSKASDELSHLQWVPISDARSFNLPFITGIVLAEIAPLIAAGGIAPANGVPHVENDDIISSVTRLM